MYFEVESDREVSIDTLGTFKPGVPQRLTTEQVLLFKLIHGISITDAKFPSFVVVTAVANEEGGAE